MEDLYAKYSKDFRNVVDRVFGEEYPELSDQLRANVSRFAAYKSNYVKTAFEENSKAFSGDDLKAVNEATKNQFRAWTDTELATASARARTAKQFSEFNEPDRKELFPCLKWLPSRAANPRQSHMRFYNHVWRKDDPFWNNNAPGTEWNCACDVEECDDQPTDNSNVKQPIVPQGLEGNPSVTGEVFTDKSSYFIRQGQFSIGKMSEKYPALQKLIDIDIEKWRLDYYSDQGGLLTSNKKRIEEGKLNKNETEKFQKEHNMCRTLATNNHIVEYRESVECEFDIYLDGRPADLKKVSSHNNIVKKAKHAVRNQGAEIVIFEFERITHEIQNKISELIQLKIHGIYFVSGKTELHYF